MDICFYSCENHLTGLGLSYFLRKYGFSFENVKNVYIPKKPSDTKSFCCKKKICGNLSFRDFKLPLFGMPENMGSDCEKTSSPEFFYDDLIKKSSFDCYEIRIDFFEHIGFCLSGGLEDVSDSFKDEINLFYNIPFIDYYAQILFELLREVLLSSGKPLIYKSLWPDENEYAVCLTHDVDEVKKTYQWITHPFRCIKNRDISGFLRQISSMKEKICKIEPYWTFEYIKKTEDALDVRSSFYFLRETAQTDPFDKKSWRHMGRRYDWNDEEISGLINDLNKNGWEVGLHGSFNSYRDFKLMSDEKKSLESVCKDDVLGIRQHNLNLDIPQTWLYQEQAGFLYDTTLGYNSHTGFRWGTCFPFRPFYSDEDRLINLIEIPMIIEDLPYFRSKEPWKNFLATEEKVCKAGGVLTLLWHHSVLNETEYPVWADSYKKIIQYCKEKNAWITSGSEICRWWLLREKNNFSYEYSYPYLKIIPVHPEYENFLSLYLPDDVNISKIHNAVILNRREGFCSIKSITSKDEMCIEIELCGVKNGDNT